MSTAKMYKEDRVCNADAGQIKAMKKAGWSLEKQTAKVEEKDEKETKEKVEVKETVKVGPPKSTGQKPTADVED